MMDRDVPKEHYDAITDYIRSNSDNITLKSVLIRFDGIIEREDLHDILGDLILTDKIRISEYYSIKWIGE